MRHGNKINKLSRTKAHRSAMLSNMACSLIEHKKINTTVAKAKALRVYLEPLLTKAKTDSTHSRRVLFSYLQDKNTITELFREIAPKIADRPGGYLRIIRIGNRQGDNAEMCLIELVDFNEVYDKEAPTEKKTRRSRRGGSTKDETTSSKDDSAKVEEKKDEAGSKEKKAVKAETSPKKDTPKAKKEAPKKAEAKTETKAKVEAKESDKKEAKDDLTQIKGIGPVHAKELNTAGFTSFDQLASLTAKDIEKLATIEGITGELVASEEWKEQATTLNNFKKLLVNLGTAKASQKDDLKKINGIGEALEKELNDIGVYTFEQISKVLVKDMEYLSALSGVTRNKIESEEWVKQAKEEAKKDDKEEK